MGVGVSMGMWVCGGVWVWVRGRVEVGAYVWGGMWMCGRVGVWARGRVEGWVGVHHCRHTSLSLSTGLCVPLQITALNP